MAEEAEVTAAPSVSPQESVDGELEHAAKGLTGAVKRRASKCERIPSPRPEPVVPVVVELVEVVEGPKGEEEAVVEVLYGENIEPAAEDIQRLVGELARKKSGPMVTPLGSPRGSAAQGTSEHASLIIIDTPHTTGRRGSQMGSPTSRSPSHATSPSRSPTGDDNPPAISPKSQLQLDKEEAAVHIERVIRGGVARKKVTRIRRERNLRPLNLSIIYFPPRDSPQQIGNENQHEAAAQNIQKIVRGGVARRKVKKLKDEQPDQAPTGHQEEKADHANGRKLPEPLVVVSDSVAHPFRLYDDHYHEAAQSIQKVVRGGTTRKKLKRQRSNGQVEEVEVDGDLQTDANEGGGSVAVAAINSAAAEAAPIPEAAHSVQPAPQPSQGRPTV